jgi:hypothetical protein
VEKVRRFCQRRYLPAYYGFELEVKVWGNSLHLLQHLPHAPIALGSDHSIIEQSVVIRIAVLRYNGSTARWRLYWTNCSDVPLAYGGPARRIETLLKKLEEDRHGCFFG